MIVFAIDPGITTGLAWKIHGIYKVAVAKDVRQVWEFIVTKPDLVLVEQFQSTQISKYGLRTVELVGAVEALCWHLDIKCIRRVPQHMGIGVAPAVRWLRAEGLPFLEHDKDALSHIMGYEKQHGVFT